MSYRKAIRVRLKDLLLEQAFKIFVAAFLFVLISLRLLNVFYFSLPIISESWSLAVALVCVGYLWIAELRSKSSLLKINRELIITQDLLKENELDSIMVVILAHEAKDPYGYGHTNRVTKYAVNLAKEAKFSADEIETIERAAKLHDLGKIGIKDSILFSAGKLSDRDFEAIKSHPLKAVTMLEPLNFLSKEKDIILHHHERFDGKGYPTGLKKDQIPQGARVIAIADSFEAMSSDRAWRKRLSKQQIISEFKNNSGTQFDPRLTDIFLKIIDRFYA